MNDPVLALLLIAAFAIAAWIAHFFRTLGNDFWSSARNPILAGLAAGFFVSFLGGGPILEITATGILLTIAALYSRLTGDESEPADGVLLGALSGAAAALPLVMNGDQPLRSFAQCVLSGAVAGFGITWAVLHVADKMRQVVWDIGTAVAAIAAAWTPIALARYGVDDRRLAIGAGALVPLLVVAAVFKQWPDVRAELRHEASLGFIDDSDVRATAHPLLRLGRGRWTDPHAHREFVRVANRIALRKRQQRYRPEEMARLYQLEVMKLRMQLQNMSRIERAAIARRTHGDELPSDTMRASE
jgi:hypothetical protein